MKFRTDFVTNSSSSSYILNNTFNKKNILKLFKKIAIYIVQLPSFLEYDEDLREDYIEDYIDVIYKDCNMQSVVNKYTDRKSIEYIIRLQINCGLSNITEEKRFARSIIKCKNLNNLIGILNISDVQLFIINDRLNTEEYNEIVGWYDGNERYVNNTDGVMEEKTKNNLVIYRSEFNFPSGLFALLLRPYCLYSEHHMG